MRVCGPGAFFVLVPVKKAKQLRYVQGPAAETELKLLQGFWHEVNGTSPNYVQGPAVETELKLLQGFWHEVNGTLLNCVDEPRMGPRILNLFNKRSRWS